MNPHRPLPHPPRRIVLVCESTGGGVGKHVIDLAEHLPAHGFEVLLVHAVRRLEHDFVERVARHAQHGYRLATFDAARAPGLGDVRGVRTLRRAVAAFGRADVLHGHSSKGGALARLARWGIARRVIYTPHAFYTQSPGLSPSKYRIYGALERVLATMTDRIITVSREEHEHARALGIALEKLALVENGIAIRPAAEVERIRAEGRARLGVRASDVVVGFLGRLVPQKAPDIALHTFARLRAQYPAARLILAGDGADAEPVQALMRQLGLQDAVRWIPDALGRELIPTFDIFLLTSRYEAFPYVLLEALDAGCAIVTPRVGGALDTVTDGSNGFVVDTPCAETLAQRVLAICQDRALLDTMRERSRARSAMFSIDRMVTRIADVYRSTHRHV